MNDVFRQRVKQAGAFVRRRLEGERERGTHEADVRTQRLRMLEDLLKEQMPDEDTRPTARTSR